VKLKIKKNSTINLTNKKGPKKIIHYLFSLFNYEIINLEYHKREDSKYFDVNWDVPENFIELYNNSYKYTMSSQSDLVNLYNSLSYVKQNNIEGSFVETGVWGGGNLIFANLYFENNNLKKTIYGFDTFSGMTEPSEFDIKNNLPDTKLKYEAMKKNVHNDWLYIPIETVRDNIESSGSNTKNINLIKGDVRQTLKKTPDFIEKISVLRIDTDFYDSTKISLEALYPLLVKGGVLILDDFGVWKGAHKATVEYFNKLGKKEFVNFRNDNSNVAYMYKT